MMNMPSVEHTTDSSLAILAVLVAEGPWWVRRQDVEQDDSGDKDDS